jgi:hypothetical protein
MNADHVSRTSFSSGQALTGSFSCCGRTNRVAVKGDRDRRAHHFEQHTNASGGVKALEFADEISKRPAEYSD